MRPRSWARRILEAATISMARVILEMLWTERMRLRMSLIGGILISPFAAAHSRVTGCKAGIVALPGLSAQACPCGEQPSPPGPLSKFDRDETKFSVLGGGLCPPSDARIWRAASPWGDIPRPPAGAPPLHPQEISTGP